MKEDPDNDSFILLSVRYLSGEASSGEREALVEALKDPELRRRFESLQRTWNDAPKPLQGGYDAKEAFSALDLGNDAPTGKPTVGKRFWRRRQWRLAAALASGIIFALAIFCYATMFHHESGADRIQWVEKRNAGGQRSAFLLSDGTRITLNADSTLMIPKNGADAGRLVRLSGEAFFEVEHDDRRPFTVELGDFRITVLGTKFNVCAYPEDGFGEVSLVSGRLLVSRTGPDGNPEQTILAPGEVYRLDGASGTGQIVTLDADRALAWMHNRVVFREERMDQVARELGRRFGVPVVLEDHSIDGMDITGSFEQESLVDIVRVICLATGLHYDAEWSAGQLDRIVIGGE